MKPEPPSDDIKNSNGMRILIIYTIINNSNITYSTCSYCAGETKYMYIFLLSCFCNSVQYFLNCVLAQIYKFVRFFPYLMRGRSLKDYRYLIKLQS